MELSEIARILERKCREVEGTKGAEEIVDLSAQLLRLMCLARWLNILYPDNRKMFN